MKMVYKERHAARAATYESPLFLQEGGYATVAIGLNVVAVLRGFESR